MFLGKRLNNGQWPLRITGGALDVDVSVCASLAVLQKHGRRCLLSIRGIKRQGQTNGQRQRQRQKETLGQWHWTLSMVGQRAERKTCDGVSGGSYKWSFVQTTPLCTFVQLCTNHPLVHLCTSLYISVQSPLPHSQNKLVNGQVAGQLGHLHLNHRQVWPT